MRPLPLDWKSLPPPIARAALQLIGKPCFLCDGEPYVIGMFTPDQDAVPRHAVGKVFVYNLCACCFADPVSAERIEVAAELSWTTWN